METRKVAHVRTAHDTSPAYSEHVARSLIAYAEASDDFRAILFHLTRHIDTVPEGAGLPDSDASLIMPTGTESAVRRTKWLLESDTLPRAKEACAALAAWCGERERQEPKAIVLGIKIGVAPLGILGKMKAEEKMPIVIRSDIRGTGAEELAGMLVKASTSVASRAFMLAGGNARQVEPEVADWFFGEKEMTLFFGDTTQMQALLAELGKLKAVHAVYSDESGPAVIAMSPAVQCSALELELGFEPQA